MVIPVDRFGRLGALIERAFVRLYALCVFPDLCERHRQCGRRLEP